MQEKNDLLPCPFCGGEGVKVGTWNNGSGHVACSKDCMDEWIYSEVWNTRTPALPAEINAHTREMLGRVRCIIGTVRQMNKELYEDAFFESDTKEALQIIDQLLGVK